MWMAPRTLLARIVGSAALVGAVASGASAQTIRPLVAEHRGEARGRLELVNQGDDPLTVVLDVQGFHVDDAGQVQDVPLGAQLVKLSASSLRVPPRQTRYVFYEATSATMPDWFVILARFSGYPRQQFNGVEVQLELPHFVYLLPADPWHEGDIVVQSASVDEATGKLTVVIENTGTRFGRVDALDVRGGGRKVTNGGFPLFPKSRRRVELDWTGGDLPATVLVRTRDFAVERALIITPP